MTLISDRDKGLHATNQVLSSNIIRLICCFHLKCNFQKRYRAMDDRFWPIANAGTAFNFTTPMQALRDANPAAADYLVGIDSYMWVTAYYTGPYFAHKTSNVVESINTVLKSEQ